MEKQSDKNIAALQLYNDIMSLYAIQRLYQTATAKRSKNYRLGNRKVNYRAIRLQDTMISLCGFADTNSLYKPFKYWQLTNKEKAFYNAFYTELRNYKLNTVAITNFL